VSEESLKQYGGVLAAPVRHPRRRRIAIVGAVHLAATLAAVALITPAAPAAPSHVNGDVCQVYGLVCY